MLSGGFAANPLPALEGGGRPRLALRHRTALPTGHAAFSRPRARHALRSRRRGPTPTERLPAVVHRQHPTRLLQRQVFRRHLLRRPRSARQRSAFPLCSSLPKTTGSSKHKPLGSYAKASRTPARWCSPARGTCFAFTHPSLYGQTILEFLQDLDSPGALGRWERRRLDQEQSA